MPKGIMTRSEIGKARKAKIFAMFAEGHTYAEIGKQFGVSRQRIQQIVRPPIQVYNALKKRAGGKCERCRISLRTGDAHVHHLDRQVTGRYDDLKRVRFLCPSCHRIEDLDLGYGRPYRTEEEKARKVFNGQ